MSGSTVTMKDVATAAGVSPMTVSRALKADSPISEETRKRILKVVKDLRYVPDQMAGSLSSKRSGFVAVLVPSLNNLHFAETVQSLTRELEKHNQQILLGYTDYSIDREERLVETMLRRRPEAIVLSYDGHSKRTIELLKGANIPIVQIWERPEAPIQHAIGFSNERAAFEMTHDLISKGYKKITFLGEPGETWTRGAVRRRGFVAAMQKSGLESGRLVSVGKAPISIEDIGVAGFGNFEVSRFSSPSISTVEVDPERIGTAAGELIGHLLEEPERSDDIVQVEVEVVNRFRASTRNS